MGSCRCWICSLLSSWTISTTWLGIHPFWDPIIWMNLFASGLNMILEQCKSFTFRFLFVITQECSLLMRNKPSETTQKVTIGNSKSSWNSFKNDYLSSIFLSFLASTFLYKTEHGFDSICPRLMFSSVQNFSISRVQYLDFTKSVSLGIQKSEKQCWYSLKTRKPYGFPGISQITVYLRKKSFFL